MRTDQNEEEQQQDVASTALLCVGDDVTIVGGDGGDFVSNVFDWEPEGMSRFVGTEATITDDLGCGFFGIDADQDDYGWHESWLKKVNTCINL